MRTICFYFQVHQPFRLANYRFFDILVLHDGGVVVVSHFCSPIVVFL